MLCAPVFVCCAGTLSTASPGSEFRARAMLLAWYIAVHIASPFATRRVSWVVLHRAHVPFLACSKAQRHCTA